MKPIIKTVGALGLAGALALSATATPSFADDRWAYAAGGFALGTVLGAAATANTRAYYGGPYAYDAWSNEPAYTYAAPAPAVTYSYPAPAVTYGYSVPAYDSFAYSPGPVIVTPRFRGSRNPSYNHWDYARGNIGG